ncbi:multidrug resistance protein 1-like [Pomacea canaliculata]|uniref:multidrug resistance protein 1-like n=1 Tax=Pomacea canaliculata TaxID=400727 RepID=UPI000D73C7A4|nr:multidrug resistance protein 1-like [Pomacea canaliculata]XP_025081233.1 multidrug resistance protein 1-like [Pomacea canaliculata]
MNLSINGSFNFDDRMTDNSIKLSYIGAGVFVASIIQIIGWVVASERQVLKIRREFFKAILRQDMAWFDSNPSGELTTRLSDDLERIREGLGDKFGSVFRSFSQFLSGLIIGFIKGWKLSLVMISIAPLLVISFGFLMKLTTSLTEKEQAAYAKAGSIAEEVFSCIRTVISFNGWHREKERYSQALQESQKLGVRKSAVQGVGVGVTMLCIFGSYGLAFWYGSRQVNDYYSSFGSEGLSPGDVLTVFFCVLSSSMALGQAAPNMGTIAAAKGAAGKVFEIIKRIPQIDASRLDGEKPHQVEGKVDFKNITFSYPTRKDVKVLKSFNLNIKPGQTVALVGGSGCGKSTLVRLIQRFYDPDEGKVELDGRDITKLNVHWLRRNIGIVSQEPVLFGCSIRDNIRLGNPTVTDEDIIQAATEANAHKFISSLPKGYDTLVGERGAQLSGGQKQRVAIARALVRNPKILLLDEATSALDSESEKIVQSALDKARKGRTTIVVAHRLSTIQNADVIYVLQDGGVAESGSHSELMEKGGLYHQLVTLQKIAFDENSDEINVTALVNEVLSESEIDEINPELVNGEAKSSVYRRPSLKRQLSKKQRHPIQKELSHQSTRNRTLSTSSSVKEPEEEAPENLPGFFHILSYNAKEWPFIFFGCFAAILNGATMPLFAVFFSKIIAVFSEKGDDLLDGGVFWSLMFVALGGLNLFTNIIQNYSFGQSGERLTKRLRLLTFQNLLRQDVAYFDDPRHATGALTARLATDASIVKTAAGIRVAVVVQSLTGVVAGVVIAFVFGWKLALVVLGTMPLMGIASAIQIKVMMGNQKADTKHLEGAGKTSSETISNIATVQSLTREPYFYEKYCKELLKPYKSNILNAQVYALSFAFASSIIFFIYAGCFRFGAYLVSTGEMDAEKVFRVFMAMTLAGQVIGQASSFLPDYSKGRLAAGYIFQMMGIKPNIDNFSTAGVKKRDAKGNIELQEVEFYYPTRPEITVLRGISLKIQAGQTAALVGVSGCGKSTVVSLLQRYYDPVKGRILIDGVDMRDYNIGVLRSLLSVVSQEPVLFDCSIHDNIVYGLQNDVPMADVIAAAKTANIHEFISNLPEGYNTNVGEKGTQLSGGQKQRVAIARALVRNPTILLLDEATSALDTESEKLVQAALDRAREGRTCVVIAHRLSTIQNADVIFVLENGQVLEQGTHQELITKKGAYAGFVSNQNIR